MGMPKRPTRYMYGLWIATLIATAGTVWLALQQPGLGVVFESSEKADSILVRSGGQAGIPSGAHALAITGVDGTRIDLLPTDIIEEPDFFNTYEEMEAFFARQTRLDAIIRSGEVRLQWQAADGRTAETKIIPDKRKLRDLPAVFWFQLIAGFGGLLIAGWVFLLRPHDWGTRMFMLTGLTFPFATSTAAIYSTRELALPGGLFQTLSSLNHFGSTGFGIALVSLFMCYPRMLVKARYLTVPLAVFGIWYLFDATHTAADLDWGCRIPLILELLLSILCAVVQWLLSRKQPLERAALRWFTLSTLLGCSLFILAVPGYSTLGLIPPLSQGYSFGFFLIMYAGIALGLRRYRLFDMDEWAYRVLLWIAGATSVITLDALLILAGMEQAMSLGSALLISGWLYFPFRQWLWQRIVNTNVVRLETLLPQISELVFVPDGEARETHWDMLLRRMFDPLEVRRSASEGAQAEIRNDGLALYLPVCSGMQARELRFAAAGRRLFSSRDAAFASTLCHLAEQVLSGREGYERGVQQERQRLARDLHDNIGARLLKLIHHLRGSPNAEIARDAMKDLRSAISAIDALPAPLQDALADWHAEVEGRCEAANVHLSWQQGEMPQLRLQPRIKAALGSALREAVTNALKHASPASVSIRIGCDEATMSVDVMNDGNLSEPEQWQEGYGLRSIRGRLHDLGGQMILGREAHAMRLTMNIPLESLGS
ncbi:MAG: hypothetical protein PHH36_00030 [Sideroxydans sp.]|nr:hypothetical protein [Sideroxydans sp.]